MAYTKDGIVRIFHSVHQKEKPPRSCDLPGGFPFSRACARQGRVAAPSVCFAAARILLAAAPTAPPCFRHWRRSSLLRIFLCFSHLRLRRRFHVSTGRYRQQRRNTSCEAANRRNEKKAFSAAASFFPFRQLLRGLKGASSPFLVDPARRNRWWFSGSLLTSKENISLNEKALCPAHRREKLVLFWFSFGTQKRT